MIYLHLGFESAKWFPNNKRNKSKDIVVEYETVNGKTVINKIKRSTLKSFVEPITVYQISNVLHVLFGQRPVPTFRKSNLKIIKEIFEIANNSYIKINKYTMKNKKGEDYPIREFIQTKKMVHNAHNPNDHEYIHWFRLKKFLGQHFDFFIEELEAILNKKDIENYIIYDIINEVKSFINVDYVNVNIEINNERLSQLFDFLKKNGKTTIVHLFTGVEYNRDKTEIVERLCTMGHANYPNKITINSGIEYVCVLSGEIIVPIKNELWLEKFSQSSGRATILDGGMIYTKNAPVDYISDKLLSSFKKVSEISTEFNP